MNRKLAITVVLSAALLFCLPAMGATTGSGVVVITQADVTKGSIPGTSGTSGFPVTITHPGSYQLGSDLLVTAGVNAIAIDASNVTLDLNGFAIRGPVTCTGSGSQLKCSGFAGAGNGIVSSRANVTVRNGKITGFSELGVTVAGPGSVLDSLSVSENMLAGISASNTLITNCTANRNGATGGIFGGSGISASTSQLKANVANGNFFNGFSLANSGATDNLAANNGLFGFSASNSLISNSTSIANFGDFQDLGGFTSAHNNMCSGSLC
jgi:hypothetical protein